MHANVLFDTIDTPELPSALTGLDWYQRLGGIVKVASTRLAVLHGGFGLSCLPFNQKRSHASGGRHL